MASSPKLRILVSSHDLRFLKPQLDRWTTDPAYDLRIEKHQFHEITEPQKCQEMLEEVDVVFCEWCLGNAVWYSQHKLPWQNLIIRIHSQELRRPFLQQVAWNQVDRLVFICPLHLKLVTEQYPELERKSVLIYNPIYCPALDKPKSFGAEFNLGLLGMCPRLKAPHMAVELLQKLKAIDSRYTLFLKGKRPEDYAWLMQRPEEREYYQEFFQQVDHSNYRNSVVFERYDTDVADWFCNIGFLLSTSEREGSHQSVAEGMASGSLPIIRNWPGADLLYPDRFVFGSTDEAVEMVLRLKTEHEYSKECLAVKQYARTHFDQAVIASQYEQLLHNLHQSPQVIQADGDSQATTTSCPGVTPQTNDDSSTAAMVAMHVCFLTPGKLNGYAIRVMEETRALTKQGVKIVIACFVPEKPPLLAREIEALQDQLEEATAATCHLIPTSQYFNTALAPGQEDQIATTLSALANAYQVNVIHGQALYSTMHALRARRMVQAKVVFDVHGVTPEEMQLSGAPAARISLMTEWERRALEEADLRVFVSSRMRHHFRHKYGLATSLPDCVVPCCVRVSRFDMAEEAWSLRRKQMGLDGRFVFLYLGTLSIWQWPEALFSVFAQFHQKRSDGLLYLLLPQGDHEKALSYCRKHGLPRESYLLSQAPHQEVGLVAGLADAGLLLRKPHPVNAVASPTKFGEYLAAGLPVVGTENIGDTSDLIASDGVGLVVSPADEGLNPEDLERVLRFAENVTANRSEWRSRARSSALRHLGWDGRAKVLHEKYSQVRGSPIPQKPLLEVSMGNVPMPGQFRKRLVITIDVEAGPHLQSGDYVDRLVWGRFGAQPVGIGRMMEIADRLGKRLTFFVDFCEVLKYPGEFAHITRHILDHGHDLQLHAHTQFLTDAFWTQRGLPPIRLSLDRYDQAHANALMEFLVQSATSMGGRHPVAFRGGAFRYNRWILEAMVQHQVPLSFNYNLKTPHQSNNHHNVGLFRWSNGIIEVPMSYAEVRDKLREFEFSSTSATDFGDRDLVRDYMDKYYSEFGRNGILVMLMHSWSFLNRKKRGQNDFYYEYLDQNLAGNFERFLGSLPNDTDIITASELHEQVRQGTVSPGLSRSTAELNC
jgi:hypothetical protein